MDRRENLRLHRKVLLRRLPLGQFRRNSRSRRPQLGLHPPPRLPGQPSAAKNHRNSAPHQPRKAQSPSLLAHTRIRRGSRFKKGVEHTAEVFNGVSSGQRGSTSLERGRVPLLGRTARSVQLARLDRYAFWGISRYFAESGRGV